MGYQTVLCFISIIVFLSPAVKLFSISSNVDHTSVEKSKETVIQYLEDESIDSCNKNYSNGFRKMVQVGYDNKGPHLPDTELMQLKFRLLKSQILQKLQFEKAPCPKLPKPQLENLLYVIENLENDEKSEDVPVVSENKESAVLYPTNIDFLCHENETEHCSLFEFKLPDGLNEGNFLSAEIFISKNDHWLESLKITSSPNFNETWENVLLHKEMLGKESPWSWSKFVSNTSALVTNLNYDNIISIKSTGVPIEQTGERRPFLIIHTKVKNDKVYPRSRRSADCVEGSTSCCRQTHYISFAEIGWDDWILKPDGYYANYCRGHCVLTDITSLLYHHGMVINRYMRYNRTAAASLGLSMCCAPDQLSPMSIIYRDESNTIFKTSIPNMIIESCSCA